MAVPCQFISYPAALGGSGGGGSVKTDFQEFDGPAGGTIVGARDGVNKTYTLSHSPNAPSLLVWISASGPMLQGIDYTLAGAVITLTAATPAPIITDTIFASYDY